MSMLAQPPGYAVYVFQHPGGGCPYDDLIGLLLRSGDRAAFRSLRKNIDGLRQSGLALLNTAMMDNIEDGIYELRAGKYRLFCFHDRRNASFVLLNGFRKQTQRTPEREKARARDLAASYQELGTQSLSRLD